MGIKQLSKLIKDKAPQAIIPRSFSYYSSSKIAVDASLAIYQFLIAVRSDGTTLGFGDNTTSHLSGLFYRTIRLVEAGIVPVYVFDGPAPAKKVYELMKRTEKREKANKLWKEAEEAGDIQKMERYEKRQVKVDKTHVDECKRLLALMGIPHLTAPSEAEAYCALLCARGLVRGVATEDMDALTFGTPVLLRNLNASQAKRLQIEEYNLKMVLEKLTLTMDEFVDLCILLGCDYCSTLKNIGPKRAYDLIKKHRSIEQILEKESLEVPEDFLYQEARGIFKELSSVGDEHSISIAYDSIDRAAVVDFMVKEKGFDETRINNGLDKLLCSKQKGKQLKLEVFFNKV